MKKLLPLSLTLLSALSLTAVAHADVMIDPVEIGMELAYQNLPLILVTVVVLVTAVILWKLRKKK